jgi:hypothetical protein
MSKEFDSDIIITTPLALQQEYSNENNLKLLLSSIEICIVDQCDIIFMQNWEYLYSCFEKLNYSPDKYFNTHNDNDKKNKDDKDENEKKIDLTRIRNFNLFN